MRKTAFLLLFVFALVQAGPAVCSIFHPTTFIFLVDEEKNDQKSDQEKKEKKDYNTFTHNNYGLTLRLRSQLHQAENLFSAPFLEKRTPPPNFS